MFPPADLVIIGRKRRALFGLLSPPQIGVAARETVAEVLGPLLEPVDAPVEGVQVIRPPHHENVGPLLAKLKLEPIRRYRPSAVDQVVDCEA